MAQPFGMFTSRDDVQSLLPDALLNVRGVPLSLRPSHLARHPVKKLMKSPPEHEAGRLTVFAPK